jgi:hypothetical protein
MSAMAGSLAVAESGGRAHGHTGHDQVQLLVVQDRDVRVYCRPLPRNK